MMEMLIFRAFIVIVSFLIALIFLITFKEAYDMEGKFGLFMNGFGFVFFVFIATATIIGNYDYYKIDIKNMKEFTLEQWLKDTTQEVVTRDGNSVKIVYTKLKNPNYPIIGIVDKDNIEVINTYTKYGNVCQHERNGDDLFIKSLKQTRWVYLYNGICDGDKIELTSISYADKEEAEKNMKRDNGFGLAKIEWEESYED